FGAGVVCASADCAEASTRTEKSISKGRKAWPGLWLRRVSRIIAAHVGQNREKLQARETRWVWKKSKRGKSFQPKVGAKRSGVRVGAGRWRWPWLRKWRKRFNSTCGQTRQLRNEEKCNLYPRLGLYSRGVVRDKARRAGRRLRRLQKSERSRTRASIFS